MVLFKQANNLIRLIDEFLNTVDEGLIIFKQGITNYLLKNHEGFLDNLKTIQTLESKADITKREIANILYTQSLLPQRRGDVLRMLEEIDDIIDLCKKNLFQFDVETPTIPFELNQDLIKLTELSCSAAENVITAARAYFRSPEQVKDSLHKVYLFEREADKLAETIKRKIFKELPIANLSEKIHLRYFTLHIETISDTAQATADNLSIMIIKQSL